MKRRDATLVIGADGFVGRALAHHLGRSGKSVLETTRRAETVSGTRIFLDLTQEISNWRIRQKVSVVYLCAAVTSLDQCRHNPARSRLVNVENVVSLARSLVENGTFVVFLSSNLVYDGAIPFRRAEDPVCPVTEYGRQKAAAERELLAFGDSISVVRLTKVIGPGGRLLNAWTQLLERREVIRPFSDMVMAPVPVGFVVQVLDQIARLRLTGIVQVSGARDVTYEQAGRYIAECIGAAQDLVQPSSARESGLEFEAIPAHTTLDTARLHRECGVNAPDVWATIRSVINETTKFMV